MSSHPVHFRVAQPLHRQQIHVLIRLALLIALGAVGFSSVYWLLYLCLPAVAALLIAQKDGARYLAEEGPLAVRGLRWLAAAYAYLWLLTDDFELRNPSPTVELEIDSGGSPTASSALLRILSSIPAVLLLMVLSIAAGLLWVIGAIAILINERMPAAIADFLELTLRYQFRLFAYHLALVQTYPSLEPEQTPHAPPGRELRSQVTAGP